MTGTNERVSARVGSVQTESLGPVWVAVSPAGLFAVEFGVSLRRFSVTLRKLIDLEPHQDTRHLLDYTRQLREYLGGKRRTFELPIDWSFISSDFQRTVLRRVLAIPYGETRTYGQIAGEIGHPKAGRAVGRANATNPMPLVIPCHRVVGSDGSLRGYGGAGGLRTKAWLLAMESGERISRPQ